MLKQIAKCCMFLSLTVPVFADTVVFYSGDFDPNNQNASGLANENDAIVGGSPTGASTYQSVLVPAGGWDVTGLFSNNLMSFTATSAYWEIRSGVSYGDGGALVASGTDNTPGFTPTGRSGFGYTEYDVLVSGLNLSLAPGQYWMTVSPENTGAGGRSFNSNTFGLNSVGFVPQNVAFFNSSFFGANFSNANNEGVFPAFSDGVIAGPAVPEPGSVTPGACGRGRRHAVGPFAAPPGLPEGDSI